MDTNQKRADRGYEALAAHPDYPFGVDFYTAASDTIADVLHAVARLDRLNRELFGAELLAEAGDDPTWDPRAFIDRALRTYLGDREDDA